MSLPLIRPEVNRNSSKQIGEPLAIGHRSLKWISYICLVILFITLLVISILPYSRKLYAAGVIVSSDGVQRVSASQSGVLVRTIAEDGHLVKEGDPLFEISSDINLSARRSAAGSALSSVQQRKKIAESLRSQNIIASEKGRLNLLSQAAHGHNEIQNINAEIRIQNERITAAEDDLARQESLVEQGFFSRFALAARKDTLLDMRQRLIQLERTRAGRESELIGTKISIDDLSSKQMLADLNFSETLEKLQQERELSEAKRRIVITSPRAGIFQGVSTLPGSFIASGQNLGSIIADGEPVGISIFIPSTAGAFPRTNMIVSLSVKAFPYERYGLLLGKVTSVSSVGVLGRELSHIPIHLDPEQIYFQVQVKINSKFSKMPAKLISGMAVDSTIRLETKPLLDWLLDTVKRKEKEALN